MLPSPTHNLLRRSLEHTVLNFRALHPYQKFEIFINSTFVKSKSFHKISFYLNFEGNNKSEKHRWNLECRFYCEWGFNEGCQRLIIFYLICCLLSFGKLLFYCLCFSFIVLNVLFWHHCSVIIIHWYVVTLGIHKNN